MNTIKIKQVSYAKELVKELEENLQRLKARSKKSTQIDWNFAGY